MKKDFREEAGACVSKLSLEEKAALGTGADFWRTQAFPEAGIPALTMSDGPSGLRYQKPGTPAKGMIVSEPATCFPALATVAASWDEELVERMGEAIGTEAKDLGVDVVLGPGLNIKRSPLCGRNFEYFSEDPYLAGKLGVSYVRGVQSTGTGSCIKHFAVNSQEYKRFSNDCIIDERTLREIYLKAFEMVVREAAPEMVMGAYVMLNGIYCSDNAHLLREILRDEWGFEGAVTTDWGGMHDRVRAYEAGCDLAMPGPAKHLAKQAARAAGQGKLDERRIDEAAERLCALALRHAAQAKPAKPLDIAASRRIARQVAAEGQVLLKNDGALPLAKGASVALIGEMAAKPRYQGGGSSHINARKVSNIHSVRPEWTYAAGYDARTGATTPELLAEAKEAARAAAVSVVVIGLPETIESEGYDRSDMRLPEGMDELVETVAAVSARTVVVLQCGSPVELPWADKVSAILYAGLGGEAGAEAEVDVLEGAVNPSGKLPETWPCHAEDAPCMGWWGDPHRQAQYREGVYVGYRYFETAGQDVAFCFGHGLSYTSFAYSALSCQERKVAFDLENVGSCEGAEVAEVYIVPPKDGLVRPDKVLAGFTRIELAPGERKHVEIGLDEKAFSFWKDGWKQVEGLYGVEVGSSISDIRLKGTIEAAGTPASALAEERLAGSWYEHPEGNPSQGDFELLLGRKVPPEAHHTKGSYDETDSLLEMAKDSRACRFMADQIQHAIVKQYDDPSDPQCRMSIASSAGCALFGLVNCSGGAMPSWLAHALLNLANGQAPWKKG